MLGRNTPSVMLHSGIFFYIKIMAEERSALWPDYVSYIGKMAVIPNNTAIFFKMFKASTKH